jgi:hypothetical protein
MTTLGGLWRTPPPAYVGLLALIAGVSLLAAAAGTPATVGGIALVYLAGIALVVSVFRRVGEGEYQRSPAPPSGGELLQMRRRQVDAQRRQGKTMPSSEEPKFSSG